MRSTILKVGIGYAVFLVQLRVFVLRVMPTAWASALSFDSMSLLDFVLTSLHVMVTQTQCYHCGVSSSTAPAVKFAKGGPGTSGGGRERGCKWGG